MPLLTKMKMTMKIKNYQELLRKKKILKEALQLQEGQIKDSAFSHVLSRLKKGNKSGKKLLGFGFFSNKGEVNPKIEQGVDLALTALSSQLLKGKNLGMVPKLALGIGILITGKIIAGKISQYTNKEGQKLIE